MADIKTENIRMIAGYYEFYLYVGDTLVFVFNDCTDSWYDYEDSKDYAELVTDVILEELEEEENWINHDMIKENKDGVINTIAEFVADWVR